MCVVSHTQVHLFGASLGGFLAQKFAEYTHKSPRVHSLILCNSFSDTSIFHQTWTANRCFFSSHYHFLLEAVSDTACVSLPSFWLMPAFLLKKIVLGNFAKGPVDPKMADAIDFMVDRVGNDGCKPGRSNNDVNSRVTSSCFIQVSLCAFLLQLESLSQSELASRLTLNCQNSYVEPHKIKDVAVTIIDVGSWSALSGSTVSVSIMSD